LASVSTRFGESRHLQSTFNAHGDVVRATGTRPFPLGEAFVPRRWGGDVGGFDSFAGRRIHAFGEVWWDLPEGRFVYWRGRITGLKLMG
jgi:hypothetical protein